MWHEKRLSVYALAEPFAALGEVHHMAVTIQMPNNSSAPSFISLSEMSSCYFLSPSASISSLDCDQEILSVLALSDFLHLHLWTGIQKRISMDCGMGFIIWTRPEEIELLHSHELCFQYLNCLIVYAVLPARSNYNGTKLRRLNREWRLKPVYNGDYWNNSK